MASIYKTIRSEDIASTRTVLHEAIPITGTIVSGTYSDGNIKNYSHGMFQSVYDYPYLSSSRIIFLILRSELQPGQLVQHYFKSKVEKAF